MPPETPVPVDIALADGTRARYLRAQFVGTGVVGAGAVTAGAALLVAADRDEFDTAVLAPLAGAGFDVLAPDPEGGLGGLADRRAGAVLEAGLEWLAAQAGIDEGRLGVLGLAGGGTHAFLLACTSRRLACAVAFDARVVYPALSAEHPIQPLELALNLSCPLAVHFLKGGAPGATSGSHPAEHAERLRAVLDQFAKEAEVHVHTAPDVHLGAGERYDGTVPAGPFAAALAFLRTHLAEPTN